MKHTRFLAVLLCLVLMLSLAACNGEPAPTTPPTTLPPETTVPTEPPLDPVQLYADAVRALEQQDAYCLDILHEKQVTVNGAVYTTAQSQKLYVSDSILQAEDSSTYGEYSTDIQEIFSDGTVYHTVDSTNFRAQISREDFLARYAPAAMLDAANYESVTADEGTDTVTVHFTQPKAAEAWLAPESAGVISAEGSATVDAAGSLTKSTYSLCYGYGNVEISHNYSVTVEAAGDAPAVPEDADAYLEIAHVDAPKLLDQTWGYLSEAQRVSAAVNQIITTQAGNLIRTTSTTVDACDDMSRVSTMIMDVDLNGGSAGSYVLDERFIDGVYQLSENGGKAETDETVTEAIMFSYWQDYLTGPIAGSADIAAAKYSDAGGILLAEFTANADWAVAAQENASIQLFGEPDLLGSLSTGYTDDLVEFYVAVDKYTGLPTSYGYTYQGTHIIERDPYILSDQLTIVYDIAGMDAYFSITEEEEPEPAPEVAPTPLLYHVTGNAGEEMWLFGTIHVGDARTAHLPQQLRDALAASDALALEVDVENMLTQIMADPELAASIATATCYLDGSTIADHLSSDVYDLSRKLMKAFGSYSAAMEIMRPSIWSSTLENGYMNQGFGLTSAKGAEMRLTEMAAELDKPLLEVESALSQMQMLGGFSDALQEFLLSSVVSGDFVEYNMELDALYEAWCAGDEAVLIDLIQEDESEIPAEELPLYQEYSQAISFDRNVAMLEAAKEYLASGDTVFYAVGLAHLLDVNGLVNTLRDAGYTVELVSYE